MGPANGVGAPLAPSIGWFRPVHCKSLPAQETRALLTARKLVQAKRNDIEMSLRGILRGFGLKAGVTDLRGAGARARDRASDVDRDRSGAPDRPPGSRRRAARAGA